MLSLPLVSVAIITYNQKPFLKEAIDSVLEQDYPNIEIVVADDCSSDGTQEMLKEYDRQFPGKFILRLGSTNRGITKNSNEAHFACNGKYIAWLGGDDLMLPGKISKQVAFLENNPGYHIVYHNLEVFDSDTGRVIKLYNLEADKREGTVEILIRYGTFNGACSNMVRKEKTPPYGFDEELSVASDWFYWIEILKDGGKIGYIDEVLGKYRRHANNVTKKSSSFYNQALLDHFLTLEKVKCYGKYAKEIRYRKSSLYVEAREFKYRQNLIKSLKYNFFNIKGWVYLGVYLITFTKVKL